MNENNTLPLHSSNVSLKQKEENSERAHERVQLLFDRAVSWLADAEQEADASIREAQLTKVKAILAGLQDSLDLDKGGNLAENLFALYSYMLKRLEEACQVGETESAPNHEPHGFQTSVLEVKNLVATLKEAWEAIQPSMGDRSVA